MDLPLAYSICNIVLLQAGTNIYNRNGDHAKHPDHQRVPHHISDLYLTQGISRMRWLIAISKKLPKLGILSTISGCKQGKTWSESRVCNKLNVGDDVVVGTRCTIKWIS